MSAPKLNVVRIVHGDTPMIFMAVILVTVNIQVSIYGYTHVILVTENVHESIHRYTHGIHSCNTCECKPARKNTHTHMI